MDASLQSLLDNMSSLEKGSFKQLIQDKSFQTLLETGMDKFLAHNSTSINEDTSKQVKTFMNKAFSDKMNSIFYVDDLLTSQMNSLAVRLNEDRKTSLIDDEMHASRGTFLHTPTGLTLDNSLKQ